MRSINPFGLRMPPELRKHIEDHAAREGRSMNAEIIHRLNKTVEDDKKLDEKLVKLFESLSIEQQEFALTFMESVMQKTKEET